MTTTLTDVITPLAAPQPIMGARMAGRKRLLAELPHLVGFALVRKQCVEFEAKLLDYHNSFYPVNAELAAQGWQSVYELADGRGVLARELPNNMVQLAVIERPKTADKVVDIDGEMFTYDADSVLYEGEEGEGLQFWFYHQLANPTDDQIIELILKRQSGF